MHPIQAPQVPYIFQPELSVVEVSSAHLFPNTRLLDQTESDRLTTLLEDEVTLNGITTPLYSLLDDLISHLNAHYLPISLFYLKGGAVNYTLLGKNITYSDIDFGIDLHSYFSLEFLKKIITTWAKSKDILLSNVKIVPDEFLPHESQNHFLIISLPTHPKKIDLQFNVRCQFQSVCSYNSLRIDISKQINELKSQKPISQPILFCVDGFQIENAETDLRDNRFCAPNAPYLFEGMRAFCNLITKGILPRFLFDEGGFIFGLVQQYSDDLIQLQISLSNYLPHHSTDRYSRILFLLNYEDAVRRSNMCDKEAVRYTLISIILDYLLSHENPFEEFGTVNIDLMNNFIENCKHYLHVKNSHLVSDQYIEHIRFLLIPINERFLVLDEFAINEKNDLKIHPKNEFIFKLFCNLFDSLDQSNSVSSPISERTVSPAHSASSGSDESETSESDPLILLKNTETPIGDRYQEGIKLISEQSKLSTSHRNQLIQVTKDLILELLSLKNYPDALNLLSIILKKRGYEKIEDVSKPFKEHVLGLFWTILNNDSEINVNEKFGYQISLFNLLIEIPKFPKKYINDCAAQLPRPDENYSDESIQNMIELDITSCGKIETNCQNILRQNLLKVILNPKYTQIVLKFFAINFHKKDNLREQKRIIEGYLNDVLKNQSQYSNDDIEKMFCLFNLVEIEGKKPFNEIFISHMTPELYIKIKKRLLKTPFDEFKSFFTKLIVNLSSLENLSEGITDIVIDGISHLLLQSKCDKERLKIFEETIPKDIIEKDQKIKKLHLNLIEKVEEKSFVSKLIKLFPEIKDKLLESKKSSYKSISFLILPQLRNNKLAENDKIKLNEIFEDEISSLMANSLTQELFAFICEYLIIHLLTDNFTKVVEYFNKISHFLDQANFEKIYEFICGYALKKDKTSELSLIYEVLKNDAKKLAYCLITLKKIANTCTSANSLVHVKLLITQLQKLSEFNGLNKHQRKLIFQSCDELRAIAEKGNVQDCFVYLSLTQYLKKLGYKTQIEVKIINKKICDYYAKYIYLRDLSKEQLKSFIVEFTQFADWDFETACAQPQSTELIPCIVNAITLNEEIRTILLCLNSKEENLTDFYQKEIDFVISKLKKIYQRLIEEYIKHPELLSEGYKFYKSTRNKYPLSKEVYALHPIFFLTTDSEFTQPPEKIRNSKMLYILADIHRNNSNYMQSKLYFLMAYELDKNIVPAYIEKFLHIFLYVKDWSNALRFQEILIKKLKQSSMELKHYELYTPEVTRLFIRLNEFAKCPVKEACPIKNFIIQFLTTPSINPQHFSILVIRVLETIDSLLISHNGDHSILHTTQDEIDVLEYIIFRILEELVDTNNHGLFLKISYLMFKNFEFSHFFNPPIYLRPFHKKMLAYLKNPDIEMFKSTEFYSVLFGLCLRSMTRDVEEYYAYKDLIAYELNQNPFLLPPQKSRLTKLLIDAIESRTKKLITGTVVEGKDSRMITEIKKFQEIHLFDIQLMAILIDSFHMRCSDEPYSEQKLKEFNEKLEGIEKKFISQKNVIGSIQDKSYFENMKKSYLAFSKTVMAFETFFQTKKCDHLVQAGLQLYLLHKDPFPAHEISYEVFNLYFHIMLRLIELIKSIEKDDPNDLNTIARSQLINTFNQFLISSNENKQKANIDLFKSLYAQVDTLITEYKTKTTIQIYWEKATELMQALT